MASDDQIKQLRSLTAEVLGVDENDITDDASAKTIPQWSSFNHLTLMSSIEDTFDIRFSTDEVTSLQTFNDIILLLHKHTS